MEIQTKQFGTLEVDEQEIYQFARPLYGLEEYKQYVLIRPDESLPFAYLQAVDDSFISLLLANPFAFHPSFEFDLPAEELALLQEPTHEDLEVWVTVNMQETLEASTMNLLAPLVFNQKHKCALQLVLHNSGYATKVPLQAEQKEAK